MASKPTDSVDAEEPNTRTSSLPRHVEADCGAVPQSGADGYAARLETRVNGGLCSCDPCYAVYIERADAEVLVCEHHVDAAEAGEYL
jgi:hypothetical protein